MKIPVSPWMKHVRWKKVAVAAVWYTAIALIFRQIEVAFTMGYYRDPAYTGLWSPLMMPDNGAPPLAFFLLSGLFTYVTGATLAAVFDFVKTVFGKGSLSRIVGFTDIMVGLTIVFGFFPMYLLFHVPAGLLAWWLGTAWVTILFTSAAFANILR